MDYRRIIGDAWAFAQKERRLMYFYGFLPAVITTIAGVIFVVYQFVSIKRYFSHESSVLADLVELVWSFVNRYPNLIPISLVIIVIIAILYMLYPSFNEGALIQIIARKRNGQNTKLVNGITYGMKSFFPLLEFNGILGLISVTALLGYATLVLRTLGYQVLQYVGIVLLIAAFLNFVFNFLFTYARYYIVVDGESVFKAIGNSTDLVVDHWQSTILVILMLLLIGLRIILNILLILVIPGLIILVAGFFASLTLSYVGYAIAVLIGLAGLYLAGYLGGVLSIFTHAVWTFTFLELTADGGMTARTVVESNTSN